MEWKLPKMEDCIPVIRVYDIPGEKDDEEKPEKVPSQNKNQSH